MGKSVFIVFIEALIIIALLFVYQHYGEKIDGLGHLRLTSILLFAIFYLSLDILRKLIHFYYRTSRNLERDQKDNFNFGIDNIFRFIIGLGSIVFVFNLFGIDFRSLVTSLSIIAAAIAITTKEYIFDFTVGLYFSFSKHFEIGDYVKIGEQKGKITEISIFKVKLLNDDDDLVVIPNSKVYNNEIINYTKRNIRLLSIDFQVDIKTIDNIDSFENELIEALSEFEEYLEQDSFNLKVVKLSKDFLDLKFQYLMKELDLDIQKKIRKRTVRKVLNIVSEKKAIE